MSAIYVTKIRKWKQEFRVSEIWNDILLGNFNHPSSAVLSVVHVNICWRWSARLLCFKCSLWEVVETFWQSRGKLSWKLSFLCSECSQDEEYKFSVIVVSTLLSVHLISRRKWPLSINGKVLQSLSQIIVRKHNNNWIHFSWII